jgi:hypothetical protein
MHEAVHAVLRAVTLAVHDAPPERLHLLVLQPQLLALHAALV